MEFEPSEAAFEAYTAVEMEKKRRQIEAESAHVDEDVVIPPIEESEPVEIKGNVTPSMDNQEKNEHNPENPRETLLKEIGESYPELNTEQGEVIKESLANIIEKGHLNLAEVQKIAYAGFCFEKKDSDVPEGYQDLKSNKKEKYIAGALDGRIYIYPEFFNDIYSDQARDHLLAHELGELIQVTEAKNKDNETEMLVNMDEYVELVKKRPRNWNDAYVESQIRLGNPRANNEMLADDIADYLVSSSPEEWVASRVSRLSEKKRRERLQQELVSGEYSQLLTDMINHAEEMISFFDAELKEKKATINQKQESEINYSDDFESALLLSGGGASAVTNMKVDTKMMDDFFDRLFGVKPIFGG